MKRSAAVHRAPVGCGQPTTTCSCICSHCNETIAMCGCVCQAARHPLHTVCGCSQPVVVRAGARPPHAATERSTGDHNGTAPLSRPYAQPYSYPYSTPYL